MISNKDIDRLYSNLGIDQGLIDELFAESVIGETSITEFGSLSDTEVKWNSPKGLFTKKAEEIVKELLKLSKDRSQAIKRITFYINRAGDKLSNKDEVLKAKEILMNN